jgi:hypothetical protein
MPFFLHSFFKMVAQTPSSLATWLIGKWKYLESSSKLIFFEGGIVFVYVVKDLRNIYEYKSLLI